MTQYRREFLNKHHKKQNILKTNKFDHFKNKNFCMTEETINKVKGQKEKILATKDQYLEYIKNFYRSKRK